MTLGIGKVLSLFFPSGLASKISPIPLQLMYVSVAMPPEIWQCKEIVSPQALLGDSMMFHDWYLSICLFKMHERSVFDRMMGNSLKSTMREWRNCQTRWT